MIESSSRIKINKINENEKNTSKKNHVVDDEVELGLNFGWIIEVLRAGTVSGVGMVSPVPKPRTCCTGRLLANLLSFFTCIAIW